MRRAADDELYGVIHLEYPVTLDDAAGRLIMRNTNAVWLQLSVTEKTPSKQVYEAPVEKVENDRVVLKLASKICSDFRVYDTCESQVEVQFQLDRLPLCQMHAAMDSLGPQQLGLLFPDPAASQITRPQVSSGTLEAYINARCKRMRQGQIAKQVACSFTCVKAQ